MFPITRIFVPWLIPNFEIHVKLTYNIVNFNGNMVMNYIRYGSTKLNSISNRVTKVLKNLMNY